MKKQIDSIGGFQSDKHLYEVNAKPLAVVAVELSDDGPKNLLRRLKQHSMAYLLVQLIKNILLIPIFVLSAAVFILTFGIDYLKRIIVFIFKNLKQFDHYVAVQLQKMAEHSMAQNVVNFYRYLRAVRPVHLLNEALRVQVAILDRMKKHLALPSSWFYRKIKSMISFVIVIPQFIASIIEEAYSEAQQIFRK